MTQETGPGTGSRWRAIGWAALLLIPIAVSVFTQLEFVQTAEGHFVRGLLWDIGRREIVADIFAPAWAVTVIVVAALNRRLLSRFDPDPDYQPSTWIARMFATTEWVYRSTWLATIGAALIVLTSWTREWARFNEQPQAFWYSLLIVATLVLSVIPPWWVRHELHEAWERRLASSSAVTGVERYLFDAANGRSRWLQAIALASIVGLGALIVIRQLDALLVGMHLDDRAPAKVGSIAGLTELDLSQKQAAVLERVSTWSDYSDSVGDAFATGYSIVATSLLIDTFVLIPAYAAGIGILALAARRWIRSDISTRSLRTYRFLTSLAIGLLAVVVTADLLENGFTWIVVDRAWNAPEELTAWSVRFLWFASAFKVAGLVALGVIGVLVLAIRRPRARGLGDSLVAVRGEVLVIALAGFALLMMGQTADVIRRWSVSTTLLTAGFVIALAMLLHWTSHRTLASLQARREAVRRGETLEPSTVPVPGSDDPPSLRRAVVTSIFALAALQILLTVGLGVPAGLGFLIPSVLIALLWLLGLPLPAAPFERGDRLITDGARRALPRLLGGAALVLVGVAVLGAAVPQLVFAEHADWYLLFLAVPVLVGLYRLHTNTGAAMGRLEVLIALGVLGVGLWMIVVNGDPELSASALAFTGAMLMLGAMPFFYSYELESGPSRFVSARMGFLRVQPILATAAAATLVVAVGLIAAPDRFAPGLGTVAIILIGCMMFAAFAAAVVAFAERTRPPDILAAFRLRRTPVFVFLAVWLALAGAAATGASNDVPVLERPEAGAEPGITVDDVWQRWADRTPSTSVSTPGEVPAVPLVLVAASGGGVRAAVWTSYVLDCVFVGGLEELDACAANTTSESPGSIIAMSGVSGGSLGLAGFSASITETMPPADWVKQRLADDYLAPAMAWLLLVDTPRSFLGFGPRVRDRAEVLEGAWERSFASAGGNSFLSRGLFELWRDEPSLPLLIFNGTSVNDPCRFNISVLDAGAHAPDGTCTSLRPFEGTTAGLAPGATLAATQDLVDYLCEGQDIAVSTAVLLSARFPVVSPSGRVGQSLESCDRQRAAFVVDGAYLEGSGAGTLVELWNQLEPRVIEINSDPSAEACVVPFFIQIDNGYENPSAAAPNRAPRETFVPVAALIGSQFGRIANARESAAIEFDSPLPSGATALRVLHSPTGQFVASRYARFTTRAHPGVQAPLGWTLSSASIDDLRTQLSSPENLLELAEVSRWLGGELSCVAEEA